MANFDVKWHSSPTLRSYGSVDYGRSGSTITISIPSCSINLPYLDDETSYAYRMAVEIVYRDEVKAWFYVKDDVGKRFSKNDLRNKPNRTCSVSDNSVKFNDNNGGTVEIRYCCCAKFPYTYGAGCDVSSEYENVL